MKGGEIELFGGGDVFRHFHDAGWFRDGLKLRSFDFMGDQKNGAIGNGDGQAFRETVKAGILCLGLCDEVCGCFSRKRNGNLIAVFRGEGGFGFVKDGIFQHDFEWKRSRINTGGVYLEKGFVSFFSEADGQAFFVAVAHAAYAL